MRSWENIVRISRVEKIYVCVSKCNVDPMIDPFIEKRKKIKSFFKYTCTTPIFNMPFFIAAKTKTTLVNINKEIRTGVVTNYLLILKNH